MAATPSQQAAIDCTGNLVMFAGPGSGKTSTSVTKSVQILAVPENSLVMTTFTKEAANEMRVRLDKKLAEEGLPPAGEDRLRISTFDSLTYWHLRNCANGKVNLLNPTAQAPRIWQLCAELAIGKFEEHSQWFDAYQATIDREPLIETINKESPNSLVLIDAYYDWLKASKMMDLATVKRTVAIQMRDANIPLLPFNHMIVDESQDSDELQILIAITMGQNECCTTLVGDDDQTIYDWRAAAGYKGMIKFRDACDAQVVRLTENFRSHEEIVGSATNLIRFNNPNRVEKNQIAVKGEGGSVKAYSFGDIELQAEWIANHISANYEHPYSIAILSRTNINLDAAESACRSYGLEFHRQGKSIFDRDDVSAYSAMMMFWLSGGGDMLSQAMGLLGFGRHTVNSVLKQLTTTQLSFRRGKPIVVEGATPEENNILADMSACFGKWRQDTKDMAYELVIRESIEMFPAWYSGLGAVAKKNGNEHPKVTAMKSVLVHVERVLLRIEGPLKSRVRFIRRKKQEDVEEGAIRLMTMHGSKGLEFDTVYIIGADEKEDDNSITAGPSERRVFFVGMTRARTNLNITYAGKFPLFLAEAGLNFQDVITDPLMAERKTLVPSEDGDFEIE